MTMEGATTWRANWARTMVRVLLRVRMERRRMPLTLSPLAIRAFTPVFDGLWRGQGEGRRRESELVGTPPHPDPLPASGERENSGRCDDPISAKYAITVSPLTSAG